MPRVRTAIIAEQKELEKLTDAELMRYDVKLYDDLIALRERRLRGLDFDRPRSEGVGVSIEAARREIERRTWAGPFSFRWIFPGFREKVMKFREHYQVVINEKDRRYALVIAQRTGIGYDATRNVVRSIFDDQSDGEGGDLKDALPDGGSDTLLQDRSK